MWIEQGMDKALRGPPREQLNSALRAAIETERRREFVGMSVNTNSRKGQYLLWGFPFISKVMRHRSRSKPIEWSPRTTVYCCF